MAISDNPPGPITNTGPDICPVCKRFEGFCICGPEESEADALKNLTTDQVLERCFEQMVLFEKRLDAQEELIANMMLAYSQITSTLEALITEVMAPRSEEEKREFKAEAKKRHLDLLRTIQEVTKDGVERRGPDVGSAVENMVLKDDAPAAES